MKSKQLNLRQYQNSVDVYDTDPWSKHYLRISEFPDRLQCGKNAFRINANADTLKVGSELYIEILDSNGDEIYHEILDYVDLDKSRLISIHVHAETPPGPFHVWIAGTASTAPNMSSFSRNKLDNSINYLWYGTGIVNPYQVVESQPLYTKPPVAKFSEKKVTYKRQADGTARLVERQLNPNHTYTIRASGNTPSQYSDSKIEFNTTFRSNRLLIEDPSNQTAKTINLPETGYSIISTTGGQFPSDCTCGKIYFKYGDVSKALPNGIVASDYTQSRLDYTGSIVEMIGQNQIVVYPQFNKSYSLETTFGTKVTQIVKSFSYSGASGSLVYFQPMVPVDTEITESILAVDVENLQPAIGDTSELLLRYKANGSLGDLLDYGTFPIDPKQNLLSDVDVPTSTKAHGIQPRDMGKFLEIGTFTSYWDVGNPYSLTINNSIDSIVLRNSAKVVYTSTTDTDFATVSIKAPVYVIADTDYVFSFDGRMGSDARQTPRQIDVYISGSAIKADVGATKLGVDLLHTNQSQVFDSHVGGVYIGSVKTKEESNIFSAFQFRAKQSGHVTVTMVLRRETTYLSNLKLQTKTEVGYAPNQYKLLVPLSKLQRNVEYLFQLEYMGASGKQSNAVGVFYGTVFDGGNTFIEGDDNFFQGDSSGSFVGQATLEKLNVNAPSTWADTYNAWALVMNHSGENPSKATFRAVNQFGSTAFAASGSSLYIPFTPAIAAVSNIGISSNGQLVIPVSDARYKYDVRDISGSLELLEKLRPVSYYLTGSDVRQFGLIAQDVESHIPELVRDVHGTKSIHYEQFIGILIDAVNELKTQIQK